MTRPQRKRSAGGHGAEMIDGVMVMPAEPEHARLIIRSAMGLGWFGLGWKGLNTDIRTRASGDWPGSLPKAARRETLAGARKAKRTCHAVAFRVGGKATNQLSS